MWKFQDYVAVDNSVPVDDWYMSLLPAERAEFDVAIDFLGRIGDWDSVKKSERKYKELERELEGLTEIKFDTTVQRGGKNLTKRFRLVGILRRDQKEFIFLGGFQKGHSGPIPNDAWERLLKHKEDFENNRGKVRDHKT